MQRHTGRLKSLREILIFASHFQREFYVVSSHFDEAVARCICLVPCIYLFAPHQLPDLISDCEPVQFIRYFLKKFMQRRMNDTYTWAFACGFVFRASRE